MRYVRTSLRGCRRTWSLRDVSAARSLGEAEGRRGAQVGHRNARPNCKTAHVRDGGEPRRAPRTGAETGAGGPPARYPTTRGEAAGVGATTRSPPGSPCPQVCRSCAAPFQCVLDAATAPPAGGYGATSLATSLAEIVSVYARPDQSPRSALSVSTRNKLEVNAALRRPTSTPSIASVGFVSDAATGGVEFAPGANFVHRDTSSYYHENQSGGDGLGGR